MAFEFFILSMTLGQILFCLSQLARRVQNQPSYLPLMLFFIANLIVALGPAVQSLANNYYLWYMAAIFPAWLSMGPALFLYVAGLTSKRAWHVRRRDLIHFIPCLFGVALALAIVQLSSELQSAIFFDEQEVESGYGLFVVLGMFAAMLTWLVQSTAYVVAIVTRLIRYRRGLKDVFASTEQRELTWIFWLLAVIVCTWALSASNLILTLGAQTTAIGANGSAVCMLVLIWTLGYWGLRQKPGFEPLNAIENNNEQVTAERVEEAHSSINQKYQKSVLSQAQSERIAAKLEQAMQEQSLYLESDLTLHALAKALVVSPNYLSQTINEYLDSNFFDYVNGWRIQHALPQVLEGNRAILDIALDAGFNARSSFYKMFKKVTGMTPSQYRKQHAQVS